MAEKLPTQPVSLHLFADPGGLPEAICYYERAITTGPRMSETSQTSHTRRICSSRPLYRDTARIDCIDPEPMLAKIDFAVTVELGAALNH